MEVMSRYMAHAVVMVSWVHTGTPCRCYRFTSRHRNKASAGEGSWQRVLVSVREKRDICEAQ